MQEVQGTTVPFDLMWYGDVRKALDGMAPHGGWIEQCYVANCPLHHDEDWSFSFDLSTRRWRCDSGCGDGDLLSLGVRLWSCGIAEAVQGLIALCGPFRVVDRRYVYLDQNGEFAFEVVRFLPKGFDCRIPADWIWKDVYRGGPRLLYRLPEVLQATDVLIVEGEKDCETARTAGLVATCNIGGSRCWHDDYVGFFLGKNVHVVADADENGRYHARQVAGSLVPVAQSVKMIEFSGVKDLTEWMEAGGTRETLLELLAAAPALTYTEAAGWWHPGGAIKLARTADFLREPQGFYA